MIVTFDTNAYRDLAKDVPLNDVKTMMSEMMNLEVQKGVTAFLGSVSSMEMLSHLVDNRFSKAYRACIRACVAAYQHCGNAQQYRMLPSIESQVAHSFFQRDNQSAINNQKTLSNLLYLIWQTPSKKTVNAKDMYPSFKSVKDKVVASEQTLIEEIWNYCMSIDPSFDNWSLFVSNQSKRTKYLNFVRSADFKVESAMALIEAVRMHLNEQYQNITLTGAEMRKMAENLVKHFPVAFKLRTYFFEQLLQPNFNLTENSRANFMWDEQILYYVGQTIQGQDILLVTTDKKMLEAANKLGYNRFVMSLKEYLKFLGFNPEPYRKKPCFIVRFYWRLKGKVFRYLKKKRN